MRPQIHAFLGKALAHHQAGRLAEAEPLYARVLAAEPRNFDALHLGGFLALQQRRDADGVDLLRRGHALNPKHVQCLLRLAHGFKIVGRIAEAHAAAARSAALEPANVDAHFLLGELTGKLEGFAAAVPHFRRVTQLQPRAADGWANLGIALAQSRAPDEALTCFDCALTLDATCASALTGRALAYQETHRISAAVAGYAAVLAQNPRHHEARSARLLALHYLDGVSRETLFAEHRAFGAATGGDGAESTFLNTRQPERRLRVGFLSPDFRTHAVAHFIEPLLTRLDRTRFEIFLYHDHVTIDATSLRIRAQADAWRHFVGQSDEVVEAAIRADAPDVLVDLSGHTGFNRLPLFARRLAPIQATYLGYPDTTGVAAMDLRLTDAIADPEGEADRFATERLVRFAPCAWTFQPAPDAPVPAAPPSTVNGYITFGCFNNFAKVSDATLRGWAGVMAAVPGSRLLLKNHGLDQPALIALLHERLAKAGIDRAQVDLLGRTSGQAAHLALYARVDVALDTFPYHGTTTTCEALWQGRPVITLLGDRHASRVGASLLTAAGHPEWIASDWAGYVRCAATLAADSAGRAGLARTLRVTFARSPLADYAGQADRFGGALREAWSSWCAQHATLLFA